MKNKGNDRNPALVLASESSARRSILAGLKLVFDVIAPDFEERVHPSASPTEIALINAEGKARAVDAGFSSDCRPAAIVIGSDQVCCTESGLILHKPGSVGRAIDQ